MPANSPADAYAIAWVRDPARTERSATSVTAAEDQRLGHRNHQLSGQHWTESVTE